MSAPNRDTIRVIFGFCLLLILAGLSLAIALGKVEEKSSFGLTQLLTILTALGTQFANWAFRGDKDKPDE